jgi:hypothetical protein
LLLPVFGWLDFPSVSSLVPPFHIFLYQNQGLLCLFLLINLRLPVLELV